MPPAVAHAPIVTSAFESLRTRWIRSASCCGRDRAFDEREVVGALDRPARRLEEVRDLDLAGEREQLVLAVEQRQLAAVARGELPDRELRLSGHSSRTSSQGSATSYRVDGAVAADQRRAELAVAAMAEAATHVPLQRQVDPPGRDAAFEERFQGEAHHDLRPADERDRRGRIEAGGRNELRYDSDLPGPAGLCGVDGHVDRCELGASARARGRRGDLRVCGRRRGGRSRRSPSAARGRAEAQA